MDVKSYFESLTIELESLKNRVRNFIHGAHWLTDGEWKESVLRSVIGRNLPDTVKIGRGFILTEQGLSSQCDILLYKGAGFIVPVAGAIKLMPGTASNPAFRRIDVDVETGKVQGLF